MIVVVFLYTPHFVSFIHKFHTLNIPISLQPAIVGIDFSFKREAKNLFYLY